MGMRRCISGMKVPCIHVIVLHPVIEVSGKVEQLNINRTADTPDFLRMKIWLTPPVKNYDLQSSFAENRKNMEWVVGKGSYKYQIQPLDQLQPGTVIIVSFIPYFDILCLGICY